MKILSLGVLCLLYLAHASLVTDIIGDPSDTVEAELVP
jgi:hypothetical protein